MTKTDTAQVTIYSTPWCAFCKTEKQYLEHLGVSFVAKDIEEDRAAYDELMEKVCDNFSGVPVTDIAGTIVRGFDRGKIDALLKEHKLVAA